MNNVVPVTGQHLQAAPLSSDQVELLKRTICRGATDDEMKLFMHVCQRTGLDPFARQIYAVKRNDNASGTSNMVIQTSIDGFRLAASRSGEYAGSDDPIIDDETQPRKATVTVYKMVQGQRCAFTATARWKEYYPGDDKKGFMWRKMPCVMLSKVAEALALRKAFPADLSGVYAKEEMDQAETAHDEPKKKLSKEAVDLTQEPLTPNIVTPVIVKQKEETRESLAAEIVDAGKVINLRKKDLVDWIKEQTGKSTPDLTLVEMKTVLAKLQFEIGRM